MSSHVRDFNLLDHVLRHTLRRQVERCAPRLDVRRRLLQRAALRRQEDGWLTVLLHGLDSGPSAPVAPFRGLDLGWRDLAFAQAMRPSGIFGSLTSLVR